MFIRRSRIFATLLIVFLLTACGGEAQSTQQPSPDGQIQRGEAPVESVEVVFLESFPLQVHLRVEGYMPDGCTEIESTEVEMQGNHFKVTIKTRRPVDTACTEAIEPFEMTVPLDVYGLAAGEYTVDVNGVKAVFTFEQDNVPQTG